MCPLLAQRTRGRDSTKALVKSKEGQRTLVTCIHDPEDRNRSTGSFEGPPQFWRGSERRKNETASGVFF